MTDMSELIIDSLSIVSAMASKDPAEKLACKVPEPGINSLTNAFVPLDETEIIFLSN